MGNSFDRKSIEKAAEELGLSIEFNSRNPGIQYSDGTCKGWEEVKADIFSSLGIDSERLEENSEGE